jgi:hypothetical protein
MNRDGMNDARQLGQAPEFRARDLLEIVGIGLVIGLLLLFLPHFSRDSYAYPRGQPPLPPTHLRADPGVNNVELTWYPSISHGLKGYWVYRGETPDNPDTYALANAGLVDGDRWIDYGTYLPLEPETDYFYCLKSVDILDQESVLCSNISNARPETPAEPDPPPPDPVQTGRLRIFVPDSGAPQGDTITVPVKIGNADGLVIESADMWMTYDPSVITATLVKPSNLLAAYGFDDYIRKESGSPAPNPAPNTGIVSAILLPPPSPPVLYGEATLFEVSLEVKGTVGGQTSTMYLPYALELNGVPYGTTIYTDVTVTGPDNAGVPLIREHGVFTVTLDSLDAPSYLLGDVHPPDTGDSVINTDDVTTARSLAVGRDLPDYPNHRQRQVGDMNGDERINSADVILIRREVLGLSTVMTSREYQWLQSHLSPAADDIVTVTLGSAVGSPGARVVLPVTVESTGPNPQGWDLHVNYDPEWLTLVDITPQLTNWQADFHVTGVPTESYSARIAYASNQPSLSVVRDGVAVSMDGVRPLGPVATGMVLSVGFEINPDAPDGATPVSVGAARATDAHGQDYESSNLQIRVDTESGLVVNMRRVYLPLVLRAS